MKGIIFRYEMAEFFERFGLKKETVVELLRAIEGFEPFETYLSCLYLSQSRSRQLLEEKCED